MLDIMGMIDQVKVLLNWRKGTASGLDAFKAIIKLLGMAAEQMENLPPGVSALSQPAMDEEELWGMLESIDKQALRLPSEAGFTWRQVVTALAKLLLPRLLGAM